LITALKNIQSLFKYINKHPLGNKHKLKAYSKFFLWQISQLVNEQVKKVKFTEKTFLLVKKGMTGATGNIYLGLHEFNDMGFLLHFLKPNDVFFDIGANVGSYTILASGHCGANTYCFEPIVSTFSSLVENVKLNTIENLVNCNNIGLGENEEKLLFTKSMDTVNHVLSKDEIEPESHVTEVQVLTGDSFLAKTECPVLMKIDVEGFETKVLNGMNQILKHQNLKAIIIELNGSGYRYGFDEQEIHNKLLSLNFNAYNYNPFNRSLELQKEYGEFNTIYLRDIPFVNDRIKSAKKINIFSESF
jgi:FkbM family methyltransferase